MTDRNLDAVVVGGKTAGNPPLIYLLNGAHVTQALLIKKRGAAPQLIVSPIEREEAVAAGYPVILNTRYNYGGLLKEHGGDVLAASVAYQAAIFDDLGVTGRVGFYGYRDQGNAYAFLKALDAALPAVEIVGEMEPTLIEAARATKDAAEVARIREVGRRTAEVVRQTVAFLQGHAVDADETLRHATENRALTVGDAHAHIHQLIIQQGLDDAEGFIFAAGRDAGVPHNHGTPDMPLRLGETIIFDIYPREPGGYFFDMTRTFCLGYAPDVAMRLYRDVADCVVHLKAVLQAGEETRSYQRMACAFYETRGHPTIGSDPATLEGYVHGLGHGVGLDIHEAPSFFDYAGNTARLTPGHVFTLEPGLYYPDQGMGCRIEDTLWLNERGEVCNLTDYPYDLVVPM
ncbi:MAG TPA: M24 family metallopeptidase [Anaerolineae bacterium]|nr:M24 family metallopeptidase [Anaerolineae bacterium]HQI85445.1 M24 family metallopeptidase [Anaerolineae bacterium]